MRAEEPAAGYDPYDADVRRDPYPYYRTLRSSSPVHHVDRLNLYTLSRHDRVVELLRRHDLYSSSQGPGPEPFLDLAAMGFAALANADEPLHAKQRKLVNWAYTPRRVAELEPTIEAISHELLNGFCERGTADYVAEYASRFPTAVAAELFGVPSEDRPRMVEMLTPFAEGLTGNAEKMSTAMTAMMAFGQYVFGKVGERRAMMDTGEHPPDDLLTALVQAEVDGERLNDPELVMIAFQVLNGGESSISMLANIVYLLSNHPEELAKVKADPALIENVVEEVLRFDPPIQGLCRTTTAAAESEGVGMEAGVRVCGLFASANRDPDYWGADAEQFRVDRELRQLRSHLSFGFGIHFCLGASLARLEGKVALRHLLARLPDFALDSSQAPVLRDPPLFFRGWYTMPIRFTPTPVRAPAATESAHL